MAFSIEKNFLFIHIPKTGGSSIVAALKPWLISPSPTRWSNFLARFRLQRDPAKAPMRQHSTLRDAYRLLPRGITDNLFKFSFVRNPWDRLVSEYLFLLSEKTHPRHQQVRALHDFEDYLRYELVRPGRTHQIECVAAPDGHAPMDFIGRFENIAGDFNTVCERIGVDAKLPRLNKPQRAHYREYYNNRTRDFVAEGWSDEIGHYGYTF